jgi:uncharacterized protein YhfF
VGAGGAREVVAALGPVEAGTRLGSCASTDGSDIDSDFFKELDSGVGQLQVVVDFDEVPQCVELVRGNGG